MNFTTFRLQPDGAILRLTFDNAPLNLVNVSMVQELFMLAGYLHSNAEYKVVVFDSADPDFFLAHFDLEEMVKAVSDPSLASKFPEINVIQSLGLTWKNLPQVTIAKVAGRCRGSGVEFISALDMRFVAEDALFCLPEASGGFIASAAPSFLTIMAGPARAQEFLLSARDFTGAEMERYNMVNRALPAEALDDYVDALAARIAQRSPAVLAMHAEMFKRLTAPFVDTIFDAFAAENDGLRTGLANGEVATTVGLLLANGQSRENDLDLPGTIDRLAAAANQKGA